MSDEEKLQSMVYEMRILEGRFNELNSQRGFILRIFTETRAGLDALRELDESSSSEVLIPLGGSIFVKGTTPPPDRVLLGIGADVVVERNRNEALKFAEDRLKDLENAIAGIEAQRNDLANRINAQRMAINKLAAQQQPPQD
jgi:prefoldin alpha subunit